MYIHIYVYICIHTYVIYIYIYRERERSRLSKVGPLRRLPRTRMCVQTTLVMVVTAYVQLLCYYIVTSSYYMCLVYIVWLCTTVQPYVCTDYVGHGCHVCRWLVTAYVQSDVSTCNVLTLLACCSASDCYKQLGSETIRDSLETTMALSQCEWFHRCMRG